MDNDRRSTDTDFYADAVRAFMVKHRQTPPTTPRLGGDVPDYASACVGDVLAFAAAKVKHLHEKHGGTDLLRIRLMVEEVVETCRGILTGNLVETADGLADSLYVVFGTAIAYGIPIDKVFEEVHRSNMSKTPLDEHSKGGKVLKAGYSPADVAGILRRAAGHGLVSDKHPSQGADAHSG